MHDLERVKMRQSRRDLCHGLLGFKHREQLGALVGRLDEVGQIGWTSLQRNVEKVLMLLFGKVSNDVGMFVGFLQQCYFM